MEEIMKSSKRNKLYELVEAARKRDPGWGGYINAYCDNPKCYVREIRATVKFFLDDKSPAMIYCPLCGKSPKAQSVESFHESKKREKEDQDRRELRDRVEKNNERLEVMPTWVWPDCEEARKIVDNT